MLHIDEYSFGRISVSGKNYSADLIIFPDHIQENWWRKKDVPDGYPGYQGRVWIRYRHKPQGFKSSDNFRETLTYPGTGGGGGYDGPWQHISSLRWQNKDPGIAVYSWDYHFFLSDFPELAKSLEQEKLMNILSNVTPDQHHTYHQEHPDIVHEDSIYLYEHQSEIA